MKEEMKKASVKDWLLGSGLLVALAGNALQYWQNTQLQKMNTQVEKISEFRESGTQLDKAVISAFDSLSNGGLTEEERRSLQESYLDHVLKTEEKREFLGPNKAERYLIALNVLKSEVDKAKDARNAGPRIEALAQVIKIRRELSEDGLDL